ncbi:MULTISPECIES: hypothetical protein [unclassified Bradyrhizobium]|uniref:hypothetical protein n=1 Tax=unclassified Bradyrhizobium TaxID=2631580 RepID=UPI001FF9B5C7|nr:MULTISPECIES: hypothetical protein [unclassified Bradyrhizobium]MCK1713058.1 hypothetical protein [Bradyrhizobium sp. 143]MCK1724599.1 hypothetical protein [Bradyrhizobium sp. 142]
MEAQSDHNAGPGRRAVVVLLLVFLILTICFGAMYYAGDLSRLQRDISAQETHSVLRDVADPEQLDQAVKLHPSNKLLRLLALASKDANEIDAAAQRLLNELEPKPLPNLGALGTLSRSDLDGLRRDLKSAESNAASVAPRYAAQIKTTRDQAEKDARSLGVGDDRLSGFMAIIDEQHGAWIALTSKMLAARGDYYNAYQKCVALLLRDFGIYKVTNGQLVFPFQSTADGYNRAATAITAAAERAAELDGERKTLRQSQLNRSKAFVGD